MKKSINLLEKTILALFIALTVLTTSCSKSEDLAIADDNDAVILKSAVIITPTVISFDEVNGTCGLQNQALIAGQNFTAGNVSISTTPDNKLLITVTTMDGWEMKKVQLYIGDYATRPVNKSLNPVPGSFPSNTSFTTYKNAVTFEYNLQDFQDCFIVALHAEVDKLNESGAVMQSESAWAAGTRFVQKGNWATYANYCKSECTEQKQECTAYQSETAFGGGTLGAGNAWWYSFNGVGTQNIYAGQNIVAGTVELVDGNLIITLTDGWELEPASAESVKIQGYSTLPSDRPAAGKFNTYKGTSLTVEVGSFPFYVIHLDVRKCTDN